MVRSGPCDFCGRTCYTLPNDNTDDGYFCTRCDNPLYRAESELRTCRSLSKIALLFIIVSIITPFWNPWGIVFTPFLFAAWWALRKDISFYQNKVNIEIARSLHDT